MSMIYLFFVQNV